MKPFHVAVVPVGKVDTEELEAALSRAARVFKRPLELRDSLPVPQGSLDSERGQHRAATMLARLREEVRKLRPGKMIGAAEDTKTPYAPDAFVFVTDQDLFTASTDGALAAMLRSAQSAVVSVRRLREAFHRRRADPVRQRARLVKEILRMSGRLAGLRECSDPTCVVSPSKALPDLDAKEERFCRACEERLLEGTMHI